MNINEFYTLAMEHQKSHDCSAVPYAFGNILTSLVMATGAGTILEVGTGIGYSTVCLALGNRNAQIKTIDKNAEHIQLAKNYFKEYGVEQQVVLHEGFAEEILPTLIQTFDLIFYDGFIPQKKFVEQFHALLRDGGLLISTNLFLGDKEGGRYVKLLRDDSQWQTGIINDEALSVKRSNK